MSPSKEECLASIQPDMKLTRSFLRRIYGYEMDYPGFAEDALNRLENVGCSLARQYYSSWVTDYETAYNAEMREVARWYIEKLKDEREIRGREVKRLRKENLRAMSRQELTRLCQRLLKDGVIADPSQFVTLVQRGY